MADERLGTIAHHVLGRLRIKLHRSPHGEAVLDAVRSALVGQPGVQEVTVSSLTGSVVIRYVPGVLGPKDLSELARAANLALVAPRSAGPAVSAEHLFRRSRAALSGLRGLGGKAALFERGSLGLRAAVPLTVAGLALYQVVRGNLRTAPWYLVLWLAVISLRRLRHRALR